MPPTTRMGASSAGQTLSVARSTLPSSKRPVVRRSSGNAGRRRIEVDDDHQADADQDAGHDAAQEQPADGNVGHRAVDDHRHARRDDRADGSGAGDQGGGEAGLVAMVLHRGHQDRSDRRRICDRRTGNAGEHHARHHRRVTQSAAPVADDGFRELDEPLRNAAGRNQLAGEDEIGQRQQAEVVQHREHLLREQRRHEAGRREDAGESDHAHDQQDRHAQRDQREQQDEEAEQHQ